MTSRHRAGRAAVLLIVMAGAAAPRPVVARPATAVDSAISHGDDSYARGHLREALASYQTASVRDAGHFGALCGLARVEADLSLNARGDERRRLAAAAVEHARAAVKIAPDSASGHLWLAVSLARQLETEGPKTRAALEREIKSELDRALGFDPALPRALFERGLWHRRNAGRGLWQKSVSRLLLAGLPRGASMDHAVRDLERSVDLQPDAIDYRLELARTYVRLKRHDEARRELERALALPGTRPRDPGLHAEARALLEKLARRG